MKNHLPTGQPADPRRGLVARFKTFSQATFAWKRLMLNRFLWTRPGRFILRHTTANQWSWSRYPLSVAVVILAWSHLFVWAGVVYLISGLTDLLDGPIAEAQGTSGMGGTKHDTIADAWEYLCSTAVICLSFGTTVWLISIGVASVLETIRLAGGSYFERRGLATAETYSPNLPGRIKNVCYHAAIIALCWRIPIVPIAAFWVGIACSFISLQLHWFDYGRKRPSQR